MANMKLFLYTCLLYLYLPRDWVGQYLGLYHDNVTHIYSAIDYYFYNYIDTLFTWPCMHQYCKYENHEAIQYSYTFQK